MTISMKRWAAIAMIVLFTCALAATLSSRDADAHAGTCGHYWYYSTNGTWHYANYSHTAYHQVYLRSAWYSGGNHYHKYRVDVYYWYSGSGWWYDHYTLNTRWC